MQKFKETDNIGEATKFAAECGYNRFVMCDDLIELLTFNSTSKSFNVQFSFFDVSFESISAATFLQTVAGLTASGIGLANDINGGKDTKEALINRYTFSCVFNSRKIHLNRYILSQLVATKL